LGCHPFYDVAFVGEVNNNDLLAGYVGRGSLIHSRKESYSEFTSVLLLDYPCGGKSIGAVTVIDT